MSLYNEIEICYLTSSFPLVPSSAIRVDELGLMSVVITVYASRVLACLL